ncbi:MAG: DinB family protein [Crocinitomicaceae bacterium]
MNIAKPTNFDPNHYFNHYINCAPNLNLLESLELTTKEMVDYMNGLSEKEGSFSYANGKWTIKQVLQHINDTERVLAYRAFRISRKDKTNMVSFDQDLYAENDYSESLTIEEIMAEFIALRQTTHLLFSKMSDAVADFEGLASNFAISPRALGFVISGHAKHHLNILKERYSK